MTRLEMVRTSLGKQVDDEFVSWEKGQCVWRYLFVGETTVVDGEVGDGVEVGFQSF